jgi:regulator of replication initiation timing
MNNKLKKEIAELRKEIAELRKENEYLTAIKNNLENANRWLQLKYKEIPIEYFSNDYWKKLLRERGIDVDKEIPMEEWSVMKKINSDNDREDLNTFFQEGIVIGKGIFLPDEPENLEWKELN